MSLVLASMPALLAGFATTIAINLAGLLAAVVVAVPLALALRAEAPIARLPARILVELVRNSPFLVLAMLVFASVGLAGLRPPPAVTGSVVVLIYASAYLAEIIRGGLAAVPSGQREGARALGLRGWPAFRLVVLPQTLPFVLPASVNLAITMVKESAALAAVAVAELTYEGQVIIGRTFAALEIWLAVGALYLVLSLALAAGGAALERRLAWRASPHI